MRGTLLHGSGDFTAGLNRRVVPEANSRAHITDNLLQQRRSTLRDEPERRAAVQRGADHVFLPRLPASEVLAVPGRPRDDCEVRDLIRQMSRENLHYSAGDDCV